MFDGDPVTLSGANDVFLSNTQNGQTIQYNSSTAKWNNATPTGGSLSTVWQYGITPRVIWNGSSWPSRASSIPSGYSGTVEYWSATDNTATPPSDRITGDIWTRVATV